VVTDALARQVGHAAALLEGELLPEVAGDVRAVGLDLLPGAGEVQPRCSCPDSADPCKHSAAVCYLVADELDRDPFLLFLLRGKTKDELLAGVRQRRGSPGRQDTSATALGSDLPVGAGWEEDAGMVAREAWDGDELSSSVTVSLPAPPRHAGRPVLLLDEAPSGSGVDAGALGASAGDAARRAWELATGAGGSGLELSFEEDCARWAALMIEGIAAPVGFDETAQRCGLERRELFGRALAWRAGGRGGLAALTESWDPPPDAMAEGREALGSGARASANRVTLGDRQMRLGRDGTWYPYRKVRGVWQADGHVAVHSDGS